MGEGEEEEEVGLSYLMKEEIQVKFVNCQIQEIKKNCLQTSVLIEPCRHRVYICSETF